MWLVTHVVISINNSWGYYVDPLNDRAKGELSRNDPPY